LNHKASYPLALHLIRIKLLFALNRPYKKWAEIFNNDSTLTSALLDRLLHHAETVLIEGSSYRMKDRLEPA
jgi:DNA replication protein DnaC